MVVPLFIGMVINTFCPTLLKIGGFTEAPSNVGYPTILGMCLFTVGTKMTVRTAPRIEAWLRHYGGEGRHGHADRGIGRQVL